jgi:hypothetical protein
VRHANAHDDVHASPADGRPLQVARAGHGAPGPAAASLGSGRVRETGNDGIRGQSMLDLQPASCLVGENFDFSTFFTPL